MRAGILDLETTMMAGRSVGMALSGFVALVLVAQPAIVRAQAASNLGTVRLTKAVMADGKALPAGTYTLRLSGDSVTPVKGQGADRAKWVEFVQDGDVKGRELASVVPTAEAKDTIKGKPPAANTSRVDLLSGGGYLRVWSFRGGNHYLIHLSISR